VTTVYVHSEGATATVTFKYDPTVVELIKDIPGWARSWNPTGKQWILTDTRYLSGLLLQLSLHGHPTVTTGRPAGHKPPRPRSAPPETWADALFEAVGQHRIEPVHRALVKILHPDVGGDTSLLQDLNVARDRRAVRR
jgi:hypothetical protein